jgi:hypothetical protein
MSRGNPNRGRYPSTRMGVTVTTPPAMSGRSAPEPFFVNPLPSTEQKRRTSLVVLVIILAFILIGLASYVALTGSAGKVINEGITEASTEASQSRQAGDDRNAPRQVTPGKAFTIGKHKTLAGWKVEKDASLGDAMFSVTGKVKNVGKAKATAYIHFKFIDKSGEVLGNVRCNSADLKPGQIQALICIPDGKYGKYKKVTAEATF